MPTKTDKPSLKIVPDFDPATPRPWQDFATAIRVAYDTSEMYRNYRALAAIGFGFVALAGKDEVPNGEFQEWLYMQLFGNQGEEGKLSFPSFDLHGKLRTARNYMSAARACRKATQLGGDAILTSSLLKWVTGQGGMDLTDPVIVAVTAYIGDRTLTEIYNDEGISRKKVVVPGVGTVTVADGQSIQQAVQMEMEEICESFKYTRSFFVLESDPAAARWPKLPVEERFEFLRTIMPVAREMAVHTSWTKPQWDEIHRFFAALDAARKAAATRDEAHALTPAK